MSPIRRSSPQAVAPVPFRGLKFTFTPRVASRSGEASSPAACGGTSSRRSRVITNPLQPCLPIDSRYNRLANERRLVSKNLYDLECQLVDLGVVLGTSQNSHNQQLLLELMMIMERRVRACLHELSRIMCELEKGAADAEAPSSS
jgi:hypothetical protein